MRTRRGATLVEYLVLVGCVLTLAVMAASVYAREIASQFAEEGRCLTSGACDSGGGDGAAAGGIAPGVTPEQVGAALTPGPPTPPVAPAPAPEGFFSRVGSGLVAGGGAVWSFGKGVVVDGAWGTVAGTAQLGYALVTSPVETTTGIASGIGNAVMNPRQTLGNMRDGFVQAWNEDPARALGSGAFQIATALVPASKAGAVARVARGADHAVPPVLPRPRGELLGEGAFSRVFADGDHVIKELKDQIQNDGRTVVLDAAGRRRLADITAEWTNRAADELGTVVPRLENLGDGVLRQPRVSGHTIDELPWHVRIDAAERMQDMMNGLEHRIGTTTPDGFHVMVDRNPANFRFDEHGNVTSWFDPIAVWPP